MDTSYRFADRSEAGHLLGAACARLDAPHPIVLGLARGGVPVAAQVAQALSAPLDVICVRKITAPDQPEYGLGAIAEGGVPVIDPLAAAAGATLTQRIEQARAELRAATFRLRGPSPPLDLTGRTAIVVDDGIATGGTARAALRAARARGARRVVLAVPVAPPEAVRALAADADAIIALLQPADLKAVGLWYHDFSPVDDETVRQILIGAAPGTPATG